MIFILKYLNFKPVIKCTLGSLLTVLLIILQNYDLYFPVENSDLFDFSYYFFISFFFLKKKKKKPFSLENGTVSLLVFGFVLDCFFFFCILLFRFFFLCCVFFSFFSLVYR